MFTEFVKGILIGLFVMFAIAFAVVPSIENAIEIRDIQDTYAGHGGTTVIRLAEDGSVDSYEFTVRMGDYK